MDEMINQINQKLDMILQALGVQGENFETMRPEAQDMKLKQEFKKQTKASDEDMEA